MVTLAGHLGCRTITKTTSVIRTSTFKEKTFFLGLLLWSNNSKSKQVAKGNNSLDFGLISLVTVHKNWKIKLGHQNFLTSVRYLKSDI